MGRSTVGQRPPLSIAVVCTVAILVLAQRLDFSRIGELGLGLGESARDGADPLGFSPARECQGPSFKGLIPEDAKEALGHGLRAKRSKSGAVSFDVLSQEAAHAPVQ
jgi:hypothetical protein